MPQRDIYHDVVRNALVKDGWTITHDPYVRAFGGRKVYVGLGAEAPIAAERDGRKIAVEVKSFLGVSAVADFEHALGQYILYGFLIEKKEPDRTLYLAVPLHVYVRFLSEPDAEAVRSAVGVRLLVFSAPGEEIDRWIE